MSIKAVNQFFNRANKARQSQAKLYREIKTGNACQAVTEFRAKHGYEFASENQLPNYPSVLEAQAANSQLSEEQLEIIAYYVWSFGI